MVNKIKAGLNSARNAKIFILGILLIFSSCQKKTVFHAESSIDVLLIGGGIMSATLGSMLTELDPELRIHAYERLDGLALESSAAWNNAGTGHASYSELNYTPELPGNIIDIKKAIEVNAAFEISKEYWAHMVKTHKIPEARSFINDVPHMSFVWGEKNCAYLKRRYEALIKHPFFKGMQYSEDHEQLKKWFPLVMKGRKPEERLAATRMVGGTDVDFGNLTKYLFAHIASSKNNEIHLMHEIVDIQKNQDKTWRVTIKDLKGDTLKVITSKFVFIGAGGAALMLLQKSGIEESQGFGGFPVGGAWLVTDNKELIEQHDAKVYGQAGVGAPPMSVPHLDTRYIDGKKALLFGPFATFTTKFLKSGSWTDLFATVNTSNVVPMIQVGFHNFNLVSYLVGQVLMTKEQRLQSLQEYMPLARLEDWQLSLAGQRVQVIKRVPEKGGILQFGTELVGDKEGTIVALLGASPGASTAVKIMLDVLNRSFKDKVKSEPWQNKLKLMVPTYGQNIADNEEFLSKVREHNAFVLGLKPAGFLMPDITP